MVEKRVQCSHMRERDTLRTIFSQHIAESFGAANARHCFFFFHSLSNRTKENKWRNIFLHLERGILEPVI